MCTHVGTCPVYELHASNIHFDPIVFILAQAIHTYVPQSFVHTKAHNESLYTRVMCVQSHMREFLRFARAIHTSSIFCANAST